MPRSYTHTYTHAHTHAHTHPPPASSLCSICNACVRLCRNIFFILINCMGAIYFPLRRWRCSGVRATLVGADKLLLTRRPAGGTRFSTKTMSTRSDTHMCKTHTHTHTYLSKYSCEDISFISTTTSNLSDVEYFPGLFKVGPG